MPLFSPGYLQCSTMNLDNEPLVSVGVFCRMGAPKLRQSVGPRPGVERMDQASTSREAYKQVPVARLDSQRKMGLLLKDEWRIVQIEIPSAST